MTAETLRSLSFDELVTACLIVEDALAADELPDSEAVALSRKRALIAHEFAARWHLAAAA